MANTINQSVALGQMTAQASRQDNVLGKGNSGISDRGKIRELSQQFESVFLEIVLKSMRDTVTKSDFIDGGNAEDIYRGMLDSEYAKIMSQSGSSSLAKNIESQLLETMGLKSEVKNNFQEVLGRATYEAQALRTDEKRATILDRK